MFHASLWRVSVVRATINRVSIFVTIQWLLETTAESRFLEPPRETKIGSRNREFKISGVNYSETNPRKTPFGSSYRSFCNLIAGQSFWEIEGSRNRSLLRSCYLHTNKGCVARRLEKSGFQWVFKRLWQFAPVSGCFEREMRNTLTNERRVAVLWANQEAHASNWTNREQNTTFPGLPALRLAISASSYRQDKQWKCGQSKNGKKKCKDETRLSQSLFCVLVIFVARFRDFVA